MFIPLTRYEQIPGTCSIAAAASTANYYNPDIDYDYALSVVKRRITKKYDQGLWSGQIGRLLNMLGFKDVTIISSDLDYLDFSWSRLSRKGLIRELSEVVKKIELPARHSARDMLKFLNIAKYQNNLLVDYQYGRHIRQSLSEGFPLLLSFNWTMFFKYAKFDTKDRPNSVKGEYEIHCVCGAGYTKTGIYIIDSHENMYKYKLKKYRKGKYHVRWEDLLACMGMQGDVIIPSNYRL